MEKTAIEEKDLLPIIEEFIHDGSSFSVVGCYCEKDYPFYYANDSFIKMLGYDNKDEFLKETSGKLINTINHDDLDLVNKDLVNGYHEGLTYEAAYRLKKKDGTYLWTGNRGKVIKTKNNELVIISLCSDLSKFMDKQKKLENEYFTSSQTLLNIPGGYHRCEPCEPYTFLYISDRFLEITGWSRQEIKEKFDNKFSNMVHPEDNKLVNEYINIVDAHANDNENYKDGVYRLLCKDGYRWFNDTTVLVEFNDTRFYQGVISDITPFIKKEEKYHKELEKALNEAKIAGQSKTNFLFNISHEIRTPLNAIKGFNDLALKNYDNPLKVKDALEKANLAGNQLLGTINEILDMSRIQSGKLVLNYDTIDVKKHIASIDAMFRQMATDKGIDFKVIDNTRTAFVCGDGQRISQIVTNLLGNAVKFTPSGGSIKYQIDEEVSADKKHTTLIVHVDDTGIGMSKEFQKKMYETFEREINTNSKAVTGSGLGLSIVKRLVDEMKGELTCDSDLGKGSKFTFKVNLAILDDVKVNNDNEAKQIDLKGLRILLVEDNELNREIAIALLSDKDCEIECAENGLEAVSKVMDKKANYYDVILMDVQMPIMDGYKATKEIRRLSDKDKANVPIIAMTANAFAEDKKKALSVGMNEHVAKPINIDDLSNAIAKVINKQ